MLKRFRFSLRVLLALVLTVALLLTAFVVPGVRQSRHAQRLWNAGAGISYGEPMVPSWIVEPVCNCLGEDFYRDTAKQYFQPISSVNFVTDWRGAALTPGSDFSIVETPERLLPVLRELPKLAEITVAAPHHDAFARQMREEFPRVEIVVMELPPGVEIEMR